MYKQASFGSFSGVLGFNSYLLLQTRFWVLCDVGDCSSQAFRQTLMHRFFELGASIGVLACTKWSLVRKSQKTSKIVELRMSYTSYEEIARSPLSLAMCS